MMVSIISPHKTRACVRLCLIRSVFDPKTLLNLFLVNKLSQSDFMIPEVLLHKYLAFCEDEKGANVVTLVQL